MATCLLEGLRILVTSSHSSLHHPWDLCLMCICFCQAVAPPNVGFTLTTDPQGLVTIVALFLVLHVLLFTSHHSKNFGGRVCFQSYPASHTSECKSFCIQHLPESFFSTASFMSGIPQATLRLWRRMGLWKCRSKDKRGDRGWGQLSAKSYLISLV